MTAPQDPGWFPDPHGARVWRWWDGFAWGDETIPMMEDVARAVGHRIEAVRVEGGGAIELRDRGAVLGRLSWGSRYPFMDTEHNDVWLEAVDGRWKAHDTHAPRDRSHIRHRVEVSDLSGRELDARVKPDDVWAVEGAWLYLPGKRGLQWVEHDQTDARAEGLLAFEERGEAGDGGSWTVGVPAGVERLGADPTPIVWAELAGGRMTIALAPQVATDRDRSLIVLLAAYIVHQWWDATEKGASGPPVNLS